MAYKRELDKGEQIVINEKAPVSKERTVIMNTAFRVKHPMGDIVITLLEKSGRRARLSIESDQEFHMEHIGAVKPKSS